MGDFKFIVFLVCFMALMGMLGFYITEDITNPVVQENINYSNSVDGETSFTSYKSGLAVITGSDILLISLIGAVLTSILVFVGLRYVRGQ